MKKNISMLNTFLVLAVLLVSCSGNSSSGNNKEEYNNTELVNCPLCGATGIWVNTMSGDMDRCALCDGTGMAPSDQAKEISDSFRQMGIDLGGEATKSGGDADYIQSQIDMYNNQIDQMQQMLSNFTSETYRTYYSQEIITLQYKVKELENQLRYLK